ncbi:Sugar carrier protein C [Acorus gramineus]|uniref:Sugar carrier protein C n=1 Tax=Acorus gramineus TaxID=55184 RepID=A0AAV9BGY9_ACOGR|nr:Sugar carrier protein C [Acorus gramineus]
MEASKAVEKLWRNILKRKYKSPLMMVVMIPFFQQLTGINVNMFYLTMLLKTIGLGDCASLLSSIITRLVNLIATFLFVFTVDRLGHRFLFLEKEEEMTTQSVNGEDERNVAMRLTSPVMTDNKRDAWSPKPIVLNSTGT